MAVTHILVVTDPARSRDFWIGVLGAELFREYGGTSVVLRFSGTWLLLVTGGGPTADKPGVVFQPPADADRVSHAMTLRVTDCQAAYEALRSRGAQFLTPPHDWGTEVRCFLRDPDGHLVEISQSGRLTGRQRLARHSVPGFHGHGIRQPGALERGQAQARIRRSSRVSAGRTSGWVPPLRSASACHRARRAAASPGR